MVLGFNETKPLESCDRGFVSFGDVLFMPVVIFIRFELKVTDTASRSSPFLRVSLKRLIAFPFDLFLRV